MHWPREGGRAAQAAKQRSAASFSESVLGSCRCPVSRDCPWASSDSHAKPAKRIHGASRSADMMPSNFVDDRASVY